MNTEALSTQYEMNRAYIESSTTPPKDGSLWRTVKDDWMHECSHCGAFVEGIHLLTRFVGEKDMPQSLIDGYKETVNEGMERYDHVFLLKRDFPWEDDGTRRLHGDLQRLQQAMIKMQLEHYYIDYTEIGGTVEERVAQVKAVLDPHRQKQYYFEKASRDERK